MNIIECKDGSGETDRKRAGCGRDERIKGKVKDQARARIERGSGCFRSAAAEKALNQSQSLEGGMEKTGLLIGSEANCLLASRSRAQNSNFEDGSSQSGEEMGGS